MPTRPGLSFIPPAGRHSSGSLRHGPSSRQASPLPRPGTLPRPLGSLMGRKSSLRDEEEIPVPPPPVAAGRPTAKEDDEMLRRRGMLPVLGIGLLAGLAVPPGAAATVSTGAGEAEVRIAAEEAARRGWLGVHIQEMTPHLAQALEVDGAGVLVSEVLADGPADAAGLQSLDVIVAVDGRTASDLDDLVTLLSDTRPGEEVELEIVRSGARRTHTVVLGEPPAAATGPGRASPEDDLFVAPGDEGGAMVPLAPRPRLGVRLLDPDDDLGAYFEMPAGGGVLITSVETGSAADDAGLKAGDLILEFDRERTPDARALQAAILMADAGRHKLAILRHGERKTLVVDLPEKRAPRSIRDHFDRLPRDPVRPPRWRPELEDENGSTSGELHELKRDLRRELRRLRDAVRRAHRSVRDDLEEEYDRLRGELDTLREELRELEETLKDE
ncbi:MAG: PDZ domain-containing protein [Candidatus Eisenbacteria bacterium]|nr:PDZ domain-containing protein [Candidatus Eisenbacteria bacterium]